MTTARRRTLRLVSAAGALVVALLYLLIGLDVITVVEDQASARPTPLYAAAALFAALALALSMRDHAAVDLAGAFLQVLVLVGYVVISSERTPAYEGWGLTVKALQVALLLALVLLALRPPERARGEASRPDRSRERSGRPAGRMSPSEWRR